MAKENPLPDGWLWTKIEDCATVVTGRTPSKRDTSNYGHYMPFVKPPELLNSSIFSAEDSISQRGAEEARVLPINSVLVSCIGNLGKTGINRVPVAFNQQINAVIFSKEVIPEFGLYYFQSLGFKKKLEEVSSATTVTIVNKSKFQSLPFPLPPLPEQERIVAKIDELFSQLDAGTAALRRIQAGLKRYKASVLKAACEGRLVPQDPSDKPTEELLRRFEELPLAQENLPSLPSGWIWMTLSQIGEISGGLTKHSKRKSFPKRMPYLRVANVYANELRLDEVLEIGVEETEIQRALLHAGDLLVVEGNGSADQIGRVAIWNGSISPCLHQNHIIKVRFEQKEVVNYVLYWLLSQGGREQIRRVASSTSGLYTLSLSKVSKLIVPLPPLAEQHRIVAEVERRLSLVTQVEAAVTAGLARADRLRQAILKRAFEGRLVPQDPSDEPAGLLESAPAAAKAKGEPTPRQARLFS